MISAALKRQLARSKQYYLTVVLSLAFALALLFSVFSLLNVVYLEPLPYRDAAGLYWMEGTIRYQGAIQPGTNPNNLFYIQKNSTHVADLAVYFPWSSYKLFDLASRPDVPVLMASHNFFDLLGVEPLLGRFFNEQEALGNKQPSAILSYRVWRDRYDGDPGIIGRQIQLNQRKFTVVGVTPDHLVLPQQLTVPETIWLPLDMDERMDPKAFRGYAGDVKAVARLAPDARFEAAAKEVSDLMLAGAAINTPDVAAQYELGGRLVSFDDAVRGESGKLALTLFVGVLLLTLIALVNLASMQLARGVSRIQPLAIAYAFGAGRRQLFKECLTHNLLLIGGACALSLVLTGLGFAVIAELASEAIPRLDSLGMNLPMLFFALVVGSLIAWLFTWVELNGVDEGRLRESLYASGKGAGKQVRKEAGHFLVGLQLGLSLLTLIPCTHILQVTLKEALRPTGVTTTDLWSVTVNFFYIIGDEEARLNLHHSLLSALSGLPGALHVTFADDKMIPDTLNMDRVYDERGEVIDSTRRTYVAPDYLQQYGVVINGRSFTGDDAQLEHYPVIVNQRLADKLTGSTQGSVIDSKISLDGKNYHSIIGVASNVDVPGAAHYEVDEVYMPRPDYALQQYSYLVSTAPNTTFTQQELIELVTQVDPRLDLARFSSAEAMFAEYRKKYLIAAWVAGALAGMSLLMVLAGTVGIVSYMARLRRYELGVKMALGAKARYLLQDNLLDFGKPIGTSLLFAFALAFLAMGISRSFPEHAFTLDWSLVLPLIALLAFFTMVACYVPIQQTLRADPIKALRNE